MLSNLYSKHHNSHSNLNNHSSLYNSKWPLPKTLCLKALLPPNNRYNNQLNLRYSNQLVLSLLMVKRLLLLSSRYSKHSNSHSSQYNSKWPPPKTLCLKALWPLSNRLNSLHSHRYSILHALS